MHKKLHSSNRTGFFYIVPNPFSKPRFFYFSCIVSQKFYSGSIHLRTFIQFYHIDVKKLFLTYLDKCMIKCDYV